ncbi:RNA binding [Homalodisca vitripennis]|nr:RNA binding [Homalodisca vitripennis]
MLLLSVCSTTLWIGHLSKLVQQEELSDTFGEFGDIVSIDLIPPRGCAFICMNRRQDAYRALQDLKHHKLQGKAITLAWAPGKGMKGKEYKDYWEVEQGVSYIPWTKLSPDIDLELLEEGGMIDEESFPEWLKEKQKKNKDDDHHRSQSSSQAGDDETSKGTELDIPVPAPTLPGYIPLPEGPQPDIKVTQPPPNMPPMMAAGPPLGMMPPFGLPNVPRLLGPMGMAMGPGLMPNVPLGVPPPGMQSLMANPLMHQQMMSRMPQPVGSPFNPPPGVGLLGGHPQLSQIPLPGSQDKGKAGLAPLGVPPPTDASGLPPFADPLMQIPFTLPPQLQMPGMGMLTRAPVTEKQVEDLIESSEKRDSSPSRNDNQFGRPPPQFSPMSLMKIPPPMTIPPPNQATSEDKDEREMKDKDYRDTMKDYKDREKDRERDRDYRNKRDRDYRGDRDYRDRFDKDYRERDKDYREKDRDRRERRDRSREREKDDKSDMDFREKDAKSDEKDRRDDSLKEDKNYRDRNDRDKGRNRDRERDRDRDRGRDRMSKWNDRDRERGRDRERDDKRVRDRERDRSKEVKGSSERDKGGSAGLQDRLRNMAHDQDRGGEFSRGSMESDSFQGPGNSKFGPRNDVFHQDGFAPDMHGHHPNNRQGFDGRGPRDMFDHRGPPPEGFDPRGPPPDGFGGRGGPLIDKFGPRGPPPDGFGPRGPPPDGFDPRGPPPGNFGPPDGFNPRGPPPDFDGQGPPPENFNMRGPPPDNFNRGMLPDNFGPGIPPPDNFQIRGPPGDEFGPHGHPPFEGFSGGPHGPPGEFQPRIRIEFFARGRGRGGLQENFRGRGGRGGPMFSPRGGGPRGPRPGWMEGQGPSPPKAGFGFPPRGFAPPDQGPERFGPPVFEDSGRGRGGQSLKNRGRGFQGRPDERRREDEEAGAPSPKRSSRWSNPSPPPSFAQAAEVRSLAMDTASLTMDTASQGQSREVNAAEAVANQNESCSDIPTVNNSTDDLNLCEKDTTQENRNTCDIEDILNSQKPSEENNEQCLESNTVSQPSADQHHLMDVPETNISSNCNVDIDSSDLRQTIREQEISSCFSQKSQSLQDTEMVDSSVPLCNENEQSSSFLANSQNIEQSEGSTAVETSFPEGMSINEEKRVSSLMGDQVSFSEDTENMHSYVEQTSLLETSKHENSYNQNFLQPAVETDQKSSEVEKSSEYMHGQEIQSVDIERSQNESHPDIFVEEQGQNYTLKADCESLVLDDVNSSNFSSDHQEQKLSSDNQTSESIEFFNPQLKLPAVIEPDSLSNIESHSSRTDVEHQPSETSVSAEESTIEQDES